MKLDEISTLTESESTSLRSRFCRRHKTRFWGQDYIITPRLLETVWGDGKKVMHLTPLATRPDYYVFLIDSHLPTDTDKFYDLLEEIYAALEDQFGRSYEEWEHDNGRTYKRHNGWPAFNDSCGTCWGRIGKRTQKPVD